MFGFETALWLLALGISVIFHEQWHARAALWLGDPTGKNMNRLSWNPIHHVDPWMTIILPLLLYTFSRGTFVFGGARPVQINALNFRNPTLGMALSAAAGPLSNFALAALGLGVLMLLNAVAPGAIMEILPPEGDTPARYLPTYNAVFLRIFVMLNVILGAFNLLPLPGLDGSRILYYFGNDALRRLLDHLEPFAIAITMLILTVPGLGLLQPVLIATHVVFFLAFGEDFTIALFSSLS